MSEQEQENKVALVIVAHPDDAEFGCAGTVAKWVREGWSISYVICTDASGGGSDDATDVGLEARQAITAIRQREQRAAGAILGLKDVIFLNYPDGRLEPTLELRRDIVRALRQYRPQRVICQSPDRSWTPVMFLGRYHPDHMAAGQATVMAIYPASQNPWDFPELLQEGLKPHKVSEIYIMGAPTTNFVVNTSDTFEQKVAALRAHASQFLDPDQIVQRITMWSAESGARHGVAYAEEFHFTKNG